MLDYLYILRILLLLILKPCITISSEIFSFEKLGYIKLEDNCEQNVQKIVEFLKNTLNENTSKNELIVEDDAFKDFMKLESIKTGLKKILDDIINYTEPTEKSDTDAKRYFSVLNSNSTDNSDNVTIVPPYYFQLLQNEYVDEEEIKNYTILCILYEYTQNEYKYNYIFYRIIKLFEFRKNELYKDELYLEIKKYKKYKEIPKIIKNIIYILG